jgi:predicted nuclease of predicted toxin-antitoxin system
MKLLFDQNLSHRICADLADIFPGSAHVRLLGLAEASDRDIWAHAKASGFAVVTLDADFADLAIHQGPPPKVIWLRLGNRPTSEAIARLRSLALVILDFGQEPHSACLEVY